MLSAKDRYAHVQSSGYGRPTSPSIKRSRSAGGQKSPLKGQSLRDETSPRRLGRERSNSRSSPSKEISPRGTLKDRSRSKLCCRNFFLDSFMF